MVSSSGPVLTPLELASSLGISRSGWLKVGEGHWSGHVVIGEKELEIVELGARSWRCGNVNRPSLEALLKELLKASRTSSSRSTT